MIMWDIVFRIISLVTIVLCLKRGGREVKKGRDFPPFELMTIFFASLVILLITADNIGDGGHGLLYDLRIEHFR